MFNHNVLAEIVGYLPYEDLYNTIRVSHLWRTASVNQLNISYRSNPILPILHNKTIHDDFVSNLYKLYHDYLTKSGISFHEYLTIINSSYSTGHDDDKFITIFDQSNKIEPLFKHVIQHLHILDGDDNYTTGTHKIESCAHRVSLFEKGFVILTYFKSLLNIVDYIRPGKFIYDEAEIYFIKWNIRVFQNEMFDR